MMRRTAAKKSQPSSYRIILALAVRWMNGVISGPLLSCSSARSARWRSSTRRGSRNSTQSIRRKGVAFVGIDSNQQDSLLEIGHYVRIHKVDFPILKDSAGKVADQFGATRTPEAFVLDADGNVRYHGRIDDQFGIGYQRTNEVRRDLANALDEVLAGKPVSTPATEPVGCYHRPHRNRSRRPVTSPTRITSRGSSTSIASAVTARVRSRRSR